MGSEFVVAAVLVYVLLGSAAVWALCRSAARDAATAPRRPVAARLTLIAGGRR